MEAFDPQRALQPLNGKSFGFKGIRQELRKIRFRYVDQLPPEFDTDELFRLAIRSNWLYETPQGEFIVRIDKSNHKPRR